MYGYSMKQQKIHSADHNHLNAITEEIIGAAIKVHSHLGPGLLESTYESCLSFELQQRGQQVARQVPQPVEYDGHRLEVGYRLDLVVEDQVVIELKATELMPPIFMGQLLTYLRHSGCPVGLLLNFGQPRLVDGIKRIVNKYQGPSPSQRQRAETN